MRLALEQRYTSDSIWTNPRAFAREIGRDIHDSPALAWQLFLRNMRARYRQSVSGYFWALAPPLAWTFLFLTLRSAGQVGSGSGDSNYVARLIVGLVFWQLFIESAQTTLRVFAEARGMLGKLRFPRESLLIAGFLDTGFQLLVRLPLLFLAWFLIPAFSTQNLWMMPVNVAALMIAGCCVGIILLPFSLLYQDVAPAFALASGFWLLITPIGYAAPPEGLAATLARWNPAAVLITTARATWLGDPVRLGGPFAAVVLSSFFLLILAWVVARVAFPHVIARFDS